MQLPLTATLHHSRGAKEVNKTTPITRSGNDVSLTAEGGQCIQCKVRDFSAYLTPEENSCIAGVAPKRRNEFSTGRWLAHQLFPKFDVRQFNLLPGEKRQPEWPPHLVGSITHTDSHAVVAIGRKTNLLGIGIDMEERGRLTNKISRRILTVTERRRYPDVDPTLIFSAKEACYKFLFPLVSEYVDYLAIEVDLDLDQGGFKLRYTGKSTQNCIADSAEGTFASIGNRWFCTVVKTVV